ncbi:MAG: biopolymer transporter ExbD [Bacteroidota bacterium]
MAVFKKKSKSKPAISTAALPDIIFMLLFFFMVSTELKEDTVIVRNELPKATQLQELAEQTLTAFIYIGPPTDARFGTDPKIQLNDVFSNVGDITRFIEEKRAEMPENLKDKLEVSLKIDKETKMGLITDVKLELRKAEARKIQYTGNKVSDLGE